MALWYSTTCSRCVRAAPHAEDVVPRHDLIPGIVVAHGGQRRDQGGTVFQSRAMPARMSMMGFALMPSTDVLP